VSVPFDITTSSLTSAERAAAPEQIFDGTYASQGRLTLQINALGGRYRAEDRLLAEYFMVEYPLGDRVRLVGGARIEHNEIEVRTTQVGRPDTLTVLRNTDLLPALALNLGLTDNQNLRFSATQTLSRPEYRELSPVDYIAEPIGGKRVRGNPDLTRALIQNLDARWEWYPRTGETVGLALFYKRFKQPIERVLIQTSDGNAPDATFQNASSADNYGVELELRKRLDNVGLPPFTVFANTTLMKSTIDVNTGDGSSLTNTSRPMAGQAEYVVNAGIEFQTAGGLSVTGLYNVVGRRIAEAGILPLPDAYEEARHLVDVSVRIPVFRQLLVKVDAKNLLNEPYRLTQGGLDQLRYDTGRVFGMGITWAP
jgi:TonB-dependent receptor